MMLYDKTMPCKGCPFRREGGVRLRPRRAREIADYATDSQGAMFACHETTGVKGRRKAKEESQCAGSLIFAEKQGRANQMTRIMERLGLYNPAAFTEAAKAAVFDDIDEMLDAQLPD